MQSKTLLIVVFFSLSTYYLFAQNIPLNVPSPIVVDRIYDGFVSKNIAYYHDTLGEMTIQNILKNDNVWLVQDSNNTNISIQPLGGYWLRFNVVNNDSMPIWIYTHFGAHEIYKARLYTYCAGVLDSSAWSGADIPIIQRPTFNSDIGFSKYLPSNSTTTFYLYAESKRLTVRTDISMWSMSNMRVLNDIRMAQIKAAMSTGLITAFAIFALLLIIFFPRPLHFWFGLFIFAGAGYQWTALGVGGELLWTNLLTFNRMAGELMGTLIVIGFLMMAHIALSIPKANKWLNYYILFTVSVGFVLVGVSIFIAYVPQIIFRNISILAALSSLFALICVFVLAIYQYTVQKSTNSGWFLLIFSIFIIGTCIVILSEIGLIPKSGFILSTLPTVIIVSEVTLTSIFMIKNLYTTLLIKERAIIDSQAKYITEMSRISADLHDEIGSTLSSISILSQVALNDLPLEKDKKRFDIIGIRIREVMDTMSDIVWSTQPYNDSMPQIIDRMKIFAVEALESQNIKLQFTVDKSAKEVRCTIGTRKDLYLIFKEAINNIAKHAHATSVLIECKHFDNNLVLQITDDGIGFDPSVLHAGNGLKNMRRRVEKIGATLDLKKNQSSGMTIIVVLPIT